MQDLRVAAMTRSFADLHLRVNPKDQQATQRLISKAANLGYSQIAIPLSPKTTADEQSKLKTACTEAGLDLVSRVDLYPKSETELTHFLRKLRRQFEVVCVTCDNKEVARQAAKDRRVDLLNFSSLDYRKRFFDRAEAELACGCLASLEIDVKPILVLEGPPRVRLLMNLRREAALAKEFGVSIVLSSGVNEERLMRAPKDMAALGYLFGLEESTALYAVSSAATDIVNRNREKLSKRFVAPGITLVEESKT
jgi:RNase P/RNase MRP subunit p30